MNNTFTTKIKEKYKALSTNTFILLFCVLSAVHILILTVCKWYLTSHYAYVFVTPALIAAMAFPLFNSRFLKKHPELFKHLLFLFNSVMMYYYMESIVRYISPTSVARLQFPIGLFITYCVYLVIGAISGNVKITLIITNSIMGIICLINKVLVDMRGRPLFLSDFTSIKTALNVSSGYKISYIRYFLILLVFVFFIIFCHLMVKRYEAETTNNLSKNKVVFLHPASRIAGIVVVVAFLLLSYCTNFYKAININLTAWSHQNGILLNWLIESKDIRVKKPENYSVETIQAASDNYKSEETPVLPPPSEFPNIIVIMNESFSDLAQVGEFHTDIEYMPFLESAIRGEQSDMYVGNAYASVHAGNTANSEYEFLTGDSMILYPHNSVPYQTFLDGKGEISSLVSHLKDMGYDTIAMHPYWASGWNRTNIYEYMGFDQQHYLDNMVNVDYIRSYCSDNADYRHLIDLFEKRDHSKPLFLFNITMQNHGGYTSKSYESTVHLTDYPNSFPQTEQYLSLIRESDKALLGLIDYFRTVDDPTIIFFFGDHQPGVETEFYEKLYGKTFNTFTDEESMRMYITKYMVWKNFDTDYNFSGDMSLNYFSSHLLKTAGLPTTAYHNYLLDMYKNYPVITANGVIDKAGKYIPVENANLSFYKQAVYNHMLDNEDYREEFFENTYTIDNTYLAENYSENEPE